MEISKKKHFHGYLFITLLLPALCFAQILPDSLDQIARKTPDKLKAALYNDFAETFLDMQPQQAILCAESVLELTDKYSNPVEKVRACRIIADALYYQNNLQEAIEMYRLSAQSEKELNGPLSKKYGERLSDVAYCYNVLAMFDYAEEYYLQALAIARENKDAEEIANNLNNLGNTFFAWGEYSQAIQHFEQALKIDQERAIDEYISVDLNNIGKVYYVWQKYDKALEYYFEALDKALLTKNENMQAIRHSNIGQAYLAINDFDLALKHLNLALNIDKRLGNTGKTGIRINHIGMLKLKQGDLDAAYEKFAEAIVIFKEQNMKISLVITLNSMGDLMNARKDYIQALKYYKQSLDIAEPSNMKATMLTSLRSISETYAYLDDYKSSYAYLQQFSMLKDSIFNEEQHRQLAEFEARYESEKKAKENLLLRQEAKNQRNQKIVSLVSGGALLLTAIFFIYLFYIKRKSLNQSRVLRKQEKRLHKLEMEQSSKENQHLQDVLFAEEQINKLQKEKLQQKNRELSTSTLHILNKNEVLGNIRKMAQQAVENEKMDKNGCFTKLIREIDNNTNLDEQWDQFKLHFESVHKGFFLRLNDKYPKLTQNELKLCAYLRLNMSSKEIAQMLHISPESVTTKRYRLRKKLGLGNEENLVSFVGRF